jgi:SagB-type dehydrogenase family enzyme
VTAGDKRRLRRAQCLIVYWQGNRLLFHNFARRLTFSARAIACELLGFFNDWRTCEEAVFYFRKYSPQSVNRALAQLRKTGFLLWKGSPAEREDSLIAKEWSAWLPEGSFHFSTKDAIYAPTNWTLDKRQRMLPRTPQPKFFKTLKGSKKIPLPKPNCPDSEFIGVLMSRRTQRQFSTKPLKLETVAQLLFFVWGVTGRFHTSLFGNLPMKTSPSGGARHPGEVYLMALRVKGLKHGLYHYHPAYHRLETISTKTTRSSAVRFCADQDYTGQAAALFLMTALFPRTMWKYDHARAYRVVLLDAGHLCQTFCLVATWLGLAPFCTAALKDTLIEEELGVDGIKESVLYVAGVGYPQLKL